MEIVKLDRQKPKYDVTVKEPHPDDAQDIPIPDAEFSPMGSETLADILRRVGGIELAAKRMIQALNAQTPNGTPDYRNRLDAATRLRDTIEGTPDKRQAPKKEAKDSLDSGGVRKR